MRVQHQPSEEQRSLRTRGLADVVEHGFGPRAAATGRRTEYIDHTGIVASAIKSGAIKIALGIKRQAIVRLFAVETIGLRTEAVEHAFAPRAIAVRRHLVEHAVVVCAATTVDPVHVAVGIEERSGG